MVNTTRRKNTRNTFGRSSTSYGGLDLAALPKNPTGACVLADGEYRCATLRADAEIIAFVEEAMPAVIAIDAPLTLPRGRCCFDDSCCGTRKIRECDRMLIHRGHRVFPPGFSFMKQLTLRGVSLKKALEPEGFRLIEVHPKTSMRILGPVDFGGAPKNEHERDACAAALVAKLYHEGLCEELGDDEGVIIIPKIGEPIDHGGTEAQRKGTTKAQRHRGSI